VEHWNPAGELAESNANIVSLIEVTAEYHWYPAADGTSN
jgi:hypothetical protein